VCDDTAFNIGKNFKDVKVLNRILQENFKFNKSEFIRGALKTKGNLDIALGTKVVSLKDITPDHLVETVNFNGGSVSLDTLRYLMKLNPSIQKSPDVIYYFLVTINSYSSYTNQNSTWYSLFNQLTELGFGYRDKRIFFEAIRGKHTKIIDYLTTHDVIYNDPLSTHLAANNEAMFKTLYSTYGISPDPFGLYLIVASGKFNSFKLFARNCLDDQLEVLKYNKTLVKAACIGRSLQLFRHLVNDSYSFCYTVVRDTVEYGMLDFFKILEETIDIEEPYEELMDYTDDLDIKDPMIKYIKRKYRP
jgi:hypothetical protein